MTRQTHNARETREHDFSEQRMKPRMSTTVIENIPLDVLDGVGVIGAVVLFALGLGTSRIFTKRQYDDRAHEAQEWRTEARLKDQTITELTEQNNILLRDIAPALTSFMDALQRAGKDRK